MSGGGPTRWKDGGAGADDAVRALLGAAPRTRPMTGADRARLTPRVARAMSLAVPGAFAWLFGKGAALAAAVGLAAVGTLAAGTLLARRDAPAAARATRTGGSSNSSNGGAPAPRPRRVAVAREASPAGGATTTQPSAPATVTIARASAPVREQVAAARAPGAVARAPRAARGAVVAADTGRAPDARGTLATATTSSAGAATAGGSGASPGAVLAPVGSQPALDTAAGGAPAPGASGGASAAAPPASALERESARLDGVHAALARDPAEALRRADALAAEFPRGQLRVEREVFAIDALLRLGRLAEARARGEALLAREPDNFHADRIRALLARAAR